MKEKLWIIKSNKGAGLPSVIIAVAFIAILGSILLTVSYSNYSMKQTNYRTKDTFYSAEQALDEINVGLQNVISNAISSAYLEVLEHYSDYDLDKKNDLMESVYFQEIWDTLGVDGVNKTTQYDVTKLRGFLFDTKWKDVNGMEYGAIITTNNNQMITYEGYGVVLKDVEIYYRDEDGYVSVIHTDIRLVLPDLEFSMNSELPNIPNYTLIADENLVTGSQGTNVISGEIYAGNLDALNSSYPSTRANLTVSNNTSFIIKNDINLENVNFVTAETSEVWAKNLEVFSSSATINGAIHLADDTNITGDGSEVTIGQIYNGYGNSLDDATRSSAILVNGTNAVLDVSDCDIVTLAGHAYIGTANYNVGDPVSGSPVGNDVLTGESITVKSNQLMYLVPAECIGVNINSGVSRYNKNPLTKSEYDSIYGVDSYVEIATDIEVPSLGTDLGEFIKYSATDSKPEVEKVFVQTSDETLVYYYMLFNDENKANEYFRTYYSINSDHMLEYLDFYSNGISIENPELMLRMQLAGNMLIYDETASVTTLQTNTLTNASEKLESTSVQYEQIHSALCTKLVSSYAELTGTDILSTDTNHVVFENLVNESDMTSFISSYSTGNAFTFYDTLDGVRTLMVDNAAGATYEYRVGSEPYIENVHLIIATGDVLVSSDFSGLILSNGTVTLANNVSVTANNPNVKEALHLTTVQAGTTYTVVNFLQDGTNLSVVDGPEEEPDSVSLADLVVYENWKKE